jgi:hypothetical protein
MRQVPATMDMRTLFLGCGCVIISGLYMNGGETDIGLN